ncbi:protein LDOC1-like [Crotalus tigris]|uniref:protein LDOC1-like n=1 Tax=Crotalus tigris TaxID=88082 RepID=UPI00192F1D13|nr:protein LDOC1-like [Crotalus tigris]
MEQLHAENAQLAQQLALLSAQVAQLSAQVMAAPPPPRRKCQVARPDEFDGNPDMFPVFMGQCHLYISVKADDFPTDRDKVGFMISLLSGSAACCGTPLLAQCSPM